VEVNHALQQTRIWSTAHFDDQPALLSEQTGLKYHAFAEALRCKGKGTFPSGSETHNEPEALGSFGIAIISRFPILDQKILTYTKYQKKTLRNALAVLIEVDGSKVWFVCTHLGCHSGPEQHAQAVELAPFLRDLAADQGAKGVILAGDTNSPPFFGAIKHLKKNGMTDTWEGGGNRSSCFGGTTFPALGWPGCYSWVCCPPLLKLDYIMYRSSGLGNTAMECDATWVVQDGDSENGEDKVDLMASDHRPLCAVFRVVGVDLSDITVTTAGRKMSKED